MSGRRNSTIAAPNPIALIHLVSAGVRIGAPARTSLIVRSWSVQGGVEYTGNHALLGIGQGQEDLTGDDAVSEASQFQLQGIPDGKCLLTRRVLRVRLPLFLHLRNHGISRVLGNRE